VGNETECPVEVPVISPGWRNEEPTTYDVSASAMRAHNPS
jgi:hypothetical protein